VLIPHTQFVREDEPIIHPSVVKERPAPRDAGAGKIK